jgi:hypothetical protein
MRIRIRAVLFALLLAALAGTAGAHAETVDLALALVSDVSRSITDESFALQKNGYQTAFTDQRVIAAIKGGPVGAIAVAYIEFAGAHEVKTIVGWTVIRDEASARDFAAAVHAAQRSAWGRTAIGAAIEYATTELAKSGHEATRKVIDVCGDGTSNAGPSITLARDSAVAAGISVNGLVILSEPAGPWAEAHVRPPGGLRKYYEDNVIGGTGSFALEAVNFQSFGEALTRKLINEIAGLTPARTNNWAAR